MNNLILMPTRIYNMPEGWFASLGDYNWSFKLGKSGAATIPLGVQVGKDFSIGKQPIMASVEAEGTAVRPGNTPNSGLILGFERTPIFEWHPN